MVFAFLEGKQRVQIQGTSKSSSGAETTVTKSTSKGSSVEGPTWSYNKPSPWGSGGPLSSRGRGGSEYRGRPSTSSGGYAPSPFAYDVDLEIQPFQSPSYTSYLAEASNLSPAHGMMEPFSPPPRPEVPLFQQRMEMLHHHERIMGPPPCPPSSVSFRKAIIFRYL